MHRLPRFIFHHEYFTVSDSYNSRKALKQMRVLVYRNTMYYIENNA